ncbi:beta-galactosidase [Cellulomonas sp. McL0617]|uniref:beta-galactosidase n=1 Tax=Cellulomonas sp. McL0617 TaxID=3415675 RepID=UPI003CF924BF
MPTPRTTSSTTLPLLAISTRGWTAAARRPAMANAEDRRPGLELTDQGLRRGGTPWIPVSGEIHYSRVPRERWAERVEQMRAGGISTVACYVPWLHHVPERGLPRFDGNLDIGAFVDVVRSAGLDLVLRIGPWAHGEMRNGGFPDWVQATPVEHRTNDPAYLDLVDEWWGQLAVALDGRCEPGTVLGIQLENELYDQPEHIRELKRLARANGFSAPFWTSTAWGGAQLPDPEVFPLFGGYGDGFWVDPDEPWDPSFREHFYFSHIWDDPGIGSDLHHAETDGAAAREGIGSLWFPPATCELGGGMATAYHRRPRPAALDIAAVAHNKIGNGSAWQGYYMYAGGTNPAGGTQESHATGYPNDMPALGYDFHAPIGEAGRLSASHAELRRQNAFLHAFGDRLAAAPSHLPDEVPRDWEDVETLRWAFRGDGQGGFLFVSWHQPFVALAPYEAARFAVRFDADTVHLPSRAIDVPTGTLAHWPVRLEIGGVALHWLTASALTLLPAAGADAVTTLVAVEDRGIPVELAVPASTLVEGAAASDQSDVDGSGTRVHVVAASSTPVRLTDASGARLDLLVLPHDLASDVWVQEGSGDSPRRLLLSTDELTWDRTGRVEVRSASTTPGVRSYDLARRSLVCVPLAHHGGAVTSLSLTPERVRAASPLVPGGYGTFVGRPSAPSASIVAADAAVYSLDLPAAAADPDACLVIEWAGDVAELVVDGTVVADRFWDGSTWIVNTTDRAVRPGATIELRVLPMSADSPVHLPADAAARRSASSEPLAAVDSVRLESRAVWREVNDTEGAHR